MKRFAVLLSLLTSPAFADQTSVPVSEISARELQAIVDERSKAVAQRFDLEKGANSQRFEAQEKAVAAALAAAKEAVAKAESAAEKRFDSVNEFRSTLKDQQVTLISRNEVEVRFKALEDKIFAQSAQITQITGRAEGANWLWGVFIAVAASVTAGLMLFLAFRRRTA